MSSSAIIRVFVPQCPAIQKEIEQNWFSLPQKTIDEFTKKANLGFELKRDDTERSIGYKTIQNEGKKKYTTGGIVKNSKTGKTTHIQIVEELAETDADTFYENYKQQVVFSLLQDECAPHRKKADKDEHGKTIKGTTGPNITPYGKAVRLACEMLGVECNDKFTISEDGKSLVRVPFVREMTEAQKESMKKGRESSSRKGVPKGQTRPVKILAAKIVELRKEREEERKFIRELYARSKEEDVEEILKQYIKEKHEGVFCMPGEDCEEDDCVCTPKEDIPDTPTTPYLPNEKEEPETANLPNEKEEPELTFEQKEKAILDRIVVTPEQAGMLFPVSQPPPVAPKSPVRVIDDMFTDSEDEEDDGSSEYMNEDESIKSFKQILKIRKNECSTKAERSEWSEEKKQKFQDAVMSRYHKDMVKFDKLYEGFGEALISFKNEFKR